MLKIVVMQLKGLRNDSNQEIRSQKELRLLGF